GRVASHGFYGVRKIFPGTCDARHVRLTTEPAFGTDLAGYARDFRGKRAQLLDHRVQRFFELQDLAAHVDRDLLRQIAIRNCSCDLGNISHLARQVAGHEVHVVSQIFPGSCDTGHLRLSTKLSVGTDFAGHASDFAGERIELVHHRVDGVFKFENFAFYVDRDLAGQVAAGNGRCHFGDVSDLTGQVPGHRVHRAG